MASEGDVTKHEASPRDLRWKIQESVLDRQKRPVSASKWWRPGGPNGWNQVGSAIALAARSCIQASACATGAKAVCKKVCRSRWSCILSPCAFWLLRSSEEKCLAVAIGAYFLDIRESRVMLLRIIGSVDVLRVVRTELMLPRGHALTLCCRVFL